MLIQVTAKHIATGSRLNPRRCPIALAFIDAGFGDVRVNVSRVKIGPESYSLSQEVGEFIRSFSIARTGQPFSFEFSPRLPLFQRLKIAINEAISYMRLS